ncbi:hypothetical protein EDD18DRAFT_1333006 [Armillaria luteobubalina]|uniref:Uncharacterized protein n=1 Tax=Armillaria luteobubalina TaxID=153913 RepID=A0AA39TLY3_9AGAR|nr:hypothetical protein EDD18DRAFT_1333006 [Armillaria luteobubalina]
MTPDTRMSGESRKETSGDLLFATYASESLLLAPPSITAKATCARQYEKKPGGDLMISPTPRIWSVPCIPIPPFTSRMRAFNSCTTQGRGCLLSIIRASGALTPRSDIVTFFPLLSKAFSQTILRDFGAGCAPSRMERGSRGLGRRMLLLGVGRDGSDCVVIRDGMG